MATSGTPANNRGYGMAVCDSSSWTKFASLESANGPRHTYVGTLCTITTLAEPARGTVATCAAVTRDVHYARCQRLDDTTTGTAAPHPETPDTMTIESNSPPTTLRPLTLQASSSLSVRTSGTTPHHSELTSTSQFAHQTTLAQPPSVNGVRTERQSSRWRVVCRPAFRGAGSRCRSSLERQ